MAYRLKDLGDLRRYLANLVNRTEAGQVEPALAGKLGYLVATMAKIIEGSDIEARIRRLEAQVSRKEHNED